MGCGGLKVGEDIISGLGPNDSTVRAHHGDHLRYSLLPLTCDTLASLQNWSDTMAVELGAGALSCAVVREHPPIRAQFSA